MSVLDVVSIFLCAASPAVGSFCVRLADRTNDGRMSEIWGRSRCDHCGQILPIWTLVPVVAWPMMRGRSGCCGKPLRIRYLAVENIALVCGLWALIATSGWITVLSLCLLWVLIWLSLVDLDCFRLPDSGTLPLVLAGLLLSLSGVTGEPLWHALGAVAGFAFVYGLRAIWLRLRGIEAIGLGDAKLLAAAGAWCGLSALPSVLLWACLAGLLAALVSGNAKGRLHAQMAIPFGPALAIGFWITWLHGPVVF